MPSINTSHHLDSNEVPKLSITTHYVLNKDGSETEKSNFHVFKIETIQSEANYFFKSDDQLQEFITQLKHLVEARSRVSSYYDQDYNEEI
jgi:hypothetical protein